ncbi:MAG: SRPBCC domain-containing protein [Methylacidiphilales bacterium]|nr:SRPBCC domain-containing protein [Candidatus Methylacidiphilales bacterium]
MSAKNKSAADTADHEITSSRVFNAPRELVWRAMTDPQHVVHWWGPRGFTTTITEMDVRPGGVWKHVMHGPDGTDYPNQSVFQEVVAPERIVYTHGGHRPGDPEVNFTSTWIFEALDAERTRVTVRMVFPTAAERDRVARDYGAVEGLSQTLARLGERLATQEGAADGEYVISRVFNAPREMVFKAWTDSKQMAQWWGPRALTVPVCELDAKTGGAFRIVMRRPDGTDYPYKGVYREIVPNERIIFIGDTSEHPAHWHELVQKNLPGGKNRPIGMLLNIVTFEEIEGKTRLTVRMRFDAAEMRDAFVKIGMNEGWSQSFDRLGELLATN